MNTNFKESNLNKILKERYFLSNESKWEDLACRVSEIYPEIKEDIIDKKFIPSSPTLMNCNTKDERKGTLSSCFPMGIDDSIEGIFDSLKEAGVVTKMAGGVGYDFSVLRGSCEPIKGLGGRVGSGSLPFISIFNETLNSVSQTGVRRGAGMAQLDIYHPDILTFIKAKENLENFTRFNFSVRVPDRFYKELDKTPNKIHKIKYVTTGEEHDLIDDNGNPITVKELWDLIIHHAHKTAEPAIFNSDIAFNQCTVTNVDKHVLANPCNEYINISYSSCNLGSIDIAKLSNDYTKLFNWGEFGDLISKATRYLNKIIDINEYPIEQIERTTKKIRPIGLGIMGLAHALYKMRIPYEGKDGQKFTEEVYDYLTLRSMQESCLMAKELGKTYDAYDEELFFKANERFFKKDFCKDIDTRVLKSQIQKYGVYNSVFTAGAPTGTIALMADTSSGVEPVFALSYSRKVEVGQNKYDIMYMTDPVFDKYLIDNFDDEVKEKILKEVSENKGSCQKIKEISERDKKVFKTAGDLTPMEHLEVFDKACQGISMSISKTVNLPSDATPEDIAEVYIEAHKRNIIGVSVYRDGCREGVLVHDIKKEQGIEDFTERHAPKRPKVLKCDVNKVTYSGEKWVVFVSLYDGKPYEIFAGKIDAVNIPKKITEGNIIKKKSKHYSFEYDDEILVDNIRQSFSNKQHDAFARSISMALRHGTPIQYVVDTLNKSEGDITDFAKVISRTLKKYVVEGTTSTLTCESCGAKMRFTDGCVTCTECGLSKCG